MPDDASCKQCQQGFQASIFFLTHHIVRVRYASGLWKPIIWTRQEHAPMQSLQNKIANSAASRLSVCASPGCPRKYHPSHSSQVQNSPIAE